MSFQTVRGMRDFLPDDTRMIRYIESQARKVAELYGYNEVITPVVESYELLGAKSGEEIRSRMFTFRDLGDRTVALRPEFTASVARLATTALRNEPKPLRLLSVGSVYRYDEPQRGRYREFWQSNYELIGSSRPEADAEIILLTNSLMKSVGLKNYAFKIGHIGVLRGILTQENVDDNLQNVILQRMDKKEYDEVLSLVGSRKCRDVLRNLLELKGGAIFQVVEKMKEYVEDYEKAVSAAENLHEILKLVEGSGSETPTTVEAGFARGLEYYTGMIFEVYMPQLDMALGGGGRYDKLIELFGGEPMPAVGVAHGLDRIMLAMQMQSVLQERGKERKVVVIPVEDELKVEALRIAQLLRDSGLIVEFEVMGRKMAKSLEDADRRKIDYAIIVGKREIREGAVVLKDLTKREQTLVKIESIIEKIKG
ncbi:MAG: histidine--tRNA ligase [Candidatus Bathycorpusculaceae bacterium]